MFLLLDVDTTSIPICLLLLLTFYCILSFVGMETFFGVSLSMSFLSYFHEFAWCLKA